MLALQMPLTSARQRQTSDASQGQRLLKRFEHPSTVDVAQIWLEKATSARCMVHTPVSVSCHADACEFSFPAHPDISYRGYMLGTAFGRPLRTGHSSERQKNVMEFAEPYNAELSELVLGSNLHLAR